MFNEEIQKEGENLINRHIPYSALKYNDPDYKEFNAIKSAIISVDFSIKSLERSHLNTPKNDINKEWENLTKIKQYLESKLKI